MRNNRGNCRYNSTFTGTLPISIYRYLSSWQVGQARRRNGGYGHQHEQRAMTADNEAGLKKRCTWGARLCDTESKAMDASRQNFDFDTFRS
jgi:hypothetical protein